MIDRRAAQILRADAVFDVVVAVVLLFGTWDGLYETLNLPQARPALLVQLGGATVLGLAYLLWVAGDDERLRRPVALGAAIANGLSAVLILIWLLFRDLGLETTGTVLLFVVAAVLAGFAAVQAQIGLGLRPPP